MVQNTIPVYAIIRGDFFAELLRVHVWIIKSPLPANQILEGASNVKNFQTLYWGQNILKEYSSGSMCRSDIIYNRVNFITESNQVYGVSAYCERSYRLHFVHNANRFHHKVRSNMV